MATTAGLQGRADASAPLQLGELRRPRATSDPGHAPQHHSGEAASQATSIFEGDYQHDDSAWSQPSEGDPEPGFAVIDGDIGGIGYNDTQVDIVAVPCPGASALRTWASHRGDEEDSTLEYRTGNNSAPMASKTAAMKLNDVQNSWIRQGIRSQINTARVLLYRHRKLRDGVTIEQLADDLLTDLSRIRQGHRESRPIFFISHSIGGLVVKRALVKAHDNGKLRSIMFDCHGMVFFGMPTLKQDRYIYTRADRP